MNGAPAKPISGTSPSSDTSCVTASRDRRNLLRLKGFHRLRRRRCVRIGCSITGPTSGTMSSSMPDARSGTTMSENRMAASTPCRAHRLQRDLGDQLGVEARLHHRVLGPQRPVLGQRAAGLPHEPHRHAAGLAAARLRPDTATRAARGGYSSAPMLPCGRPTADRSASPRDRYGAPAHRPGQDGLASNGVTTAEPAQFREAVAAMNATTVRPEIELGPIRPPQRLAPFSYALGAEVRHPETAIVPERSEGDAFGRLILLHDPEGAEAWDGTMRLVAYIQADLDSSEAVDPLLPEVAWSWLVEALESRRRARHGAGRHRHRDHVGALRRHLRAAARPPAGAAGVVDGDDAGARPARRRRSARCSSTPRACLRPGSPI